MPSLTFFFLLILAYLLGSIPPAIWISKYIYKRDIRQEGSGNAGSTNMFRIYGKKAGIATQLIDIAKGAVAASLPFWLNDSSGEVSLGIQSVSCGILAVIGHIWPIFAGFKGGKGINTLLGMMLIVNPVAAIVCLLVFLGVLFFSHYVSLSSLAATLTFPLFQLLGDLLQGRMLNWAMTFLGFSLFFLVLFTHKENVKRLIRGEENEASIFKRK